jgi:GxxExxY protein
MTTLFIGSLPADLEEIAHRVIGCGLRVHTALGPGFKESIYQEAMCLEMNASGLSFEREKPIVVRYRDWDIPGQRLDLVVEGRIVVELKAVRRLKEVHRRQVVSYLKAANLRLGIVMNFNTNHLRQGIKRVVN